MSRISCSHLSISLYSQFPFILAFTAFCPLLSIKSEEAATFGAGLGEGFEIGGKLAIWVIAAAIEGALLFTPPLYQLTPAFRTANAGFNLEGFGIFALRVTTAG